MNTITLEIDSREVQRALQLGSKALQAEMARAVRRIIGEMARSAKGYAPKAFTTLTNSLIPRMVGPLTGEVRPGVDYAEYVETGTGPGGFPPEQILLEWIQRKAISPHDPRMTVEDLAFVMARSIAAKGTPAQPYLQPAFDEKLPRASALADAAIERTLQAMGRAV